MQSILGLQKKIIACERCPRLRKYCLKIAEEKRAAFRNERYWGKPVPSFGDPRSEFFILGLAPAAHGANRTGRMFTGDRSGDWLYRALYKAGFANQPLSSHKQDGLALKNSWISAAAHCAPPENKPSREELIRCADFLKSEISLMPQVKVYLALGGLALQAIWPLLEASGRKPKFAHGKEIPLPGGKTL